MADPGAISPYYDLYEGPLTDNLSNMLKDYENPSLLDGPAVDPIGGNTSTQPSNSRPDHHDPNLIEQNPDTNWDFLIDFNDDQGLGSGSNQAGSSRVHDQEMNNNNNNDRHDENLRVDQENLELLQVNNPSNNSNGNSRSLSIWPLPPVPFNCSCCQVLREIIHVNELNNYIKLEIHGRLGMISHAICERKTTNNNNVTTSTTPSANPQFEMLEFSRQSIEDVKRFLVEYCSKRKEEGYVMVHDPLSIFYEALCVGLEWDDFSNFDFDFLSTSPLNSGGGGNYMDQQGVQQEQQGQQEQQVQVPNQQEQIDPPQLEPTENSVERNRRISLAEQRQRTGKLTLEDLSEYLHLTIEDAAKAMNVCPTVLKKICRRNNLARWPHRKIKSIKRQISSLRPSLKSNNQQIREQAQAEIDKLRQNAINICAGVDVLGL